MSAPISPRIVGRMRREFMLCDSVRPFQARGIAPVRMAVTGQSTGIRGMTVRNWCSTVRCNYVDIEVHQPLTRNVRAGSAHSVPGVAGGTSEAVVDVPAVLGEARVRNDDAQIVALAAQPVRAIHAEIGVGKQVGDEL